MSASPSSSSSSSSSCPSSSPSRSPASLRAPVALRAAAALLLLAARGGALALRFDVPAGLTKCLGEHVGKNELAKGSYAAVGVVSNDGQKSRLDVRITGPADQVEHQGTDVGAGKFGFTASESGSHRVCFTNRGLVPRSVELEFSAGVDAADYTDLARKEHLKPLELQLRKMEDRVEAVHREMMAQREREEAHRNTNENTNSRVQWFSVLTIAIVLATAGFQMRYLYRFLDQSKVFMGVGRL